MTSAIAAEFPHAVYRGHGPSGSAEPLPTPVRLYSALVHAAYTGPTAVPDPKDPRRLRPSEDALRALAWVEANPPDCLEVPEVLPVSTADRAAYRDEGWLEKEAASKSIRNKKSKKPLSDGFTLGGRIAWGWQSTDIPKDVALVLDGLCADIGYLGETDSPAFLGVVGDLEPTHLLTPAPTPQDLRLGTVLPVAAEGRRHILDAWHDSLNPTGKKALKPEKSAWTAPPPPPSAPRNGVRRALYSPVDREVVDAPWEIVLLLQVTGLNPDLSPAHRVRLATAAHRSLVRLAGQGEISPLLTGVGGAGRALANGLAIHLLDEEQSRRTAAGVRASHLAIMVPHGATGEDIDQVLSAAGRLRRIYDRDAGALSIVEGSERILDGASFWAEPADGTVRRWKTQSPAVAERRTKRLGSLSDLDVTVLWSLGNVFRDLRREDLIEDRTPAERLLATAAAMSDDEDTASLSTRHHVTTAPYRLVHRTNGRMPIRPYDAELHAPGLLSQSGVVALGQSRHLGGGLLLPEDIPSTEGGGR